MGEPTSRSSFYKDTCKTKGALNNSVQLNGKELSFNNINDVMELWSY